jgi:crotonobetainyl-CoA:carnitine CoA-transferase CaiB-like acyl-CoA transferase
VGALPGITVADFAGGLMAATSILAALHSDHTSYIDLSLTDAVLSWLHMQAPQIWAGQSEARTFLSGDFACYRAYETAGGGRITVAALEPKFWRQLCEALGRPELIDGQFDRERQARAIADLERIFRERTRDEWVERLASLPVAPVTTLAEALEHPQFRDRGVLGRTPIPYLAFPGGSSSSPRRAPALDEHRSEVLG